MSDERRYYLPDANRVGVLTATVLLAYALARLIETQRYTLDVSVAGIALSIPLNLTVALILLATGLTATGMDWLLRSHPSFNQANTFEHWLLPALTALVIGVPLYTLSGGLEWWLTFALGGLLLVIVFLAEYIVLDPQDARYAAASAALMAVSFALYLILVSALRYAEVRLYLLLPAIFPASALVSLRALHLRLNSRWEFGWAAGLGLVSVQIAAVFHYWPVSPIQFGLVLLGPLYALINMALSVLEGSSARRTVIGTLGVVIGFWALALWMRL
jgi:hypothetical protein